MNSTTYFLLFKREFYETKNILKWALIITILACVLGALQISHPYEWIAARYIDFFYTVIGFFVAIQAFDEFSVSAKLRAYLMIPANASEKLISKLIFYIIGWLLLFVVVWLCSTIIANVILLIFNGNILTFAQIFAIFIILPKILLFAVLMQSIAIFAGCYFKRLVIVKLLVSYVLIYLPLSTLIANEINMLLDYFTMCGFINDGTAIFIFAIPLFQVIGIFILWLLTWLRIRESEVIN